MRVCVFQLQEYLVVSMFTNPLLQLNRERHDVLEELRTQIDVWLTSHPNRSQKLLASRAGISTTTLNDILQCRRGCSTEVYEAITKALNSSGAKIVGLQEFGKKIGREMKLDERNMEVTRTRHIQELANRQRVNNLARLRGEQTL
jgi:hypothetical protein